MIVTTSNAELTEHAEGKLFCEFSGFCVVRRYMPGGVKRPSAAVQPPST